MNKLNTFLNTVVGVSIISLIIAVALNQFELKKLSQELESKTTQIAELQEQIKLQDEKIKKTFIIIKEGFEAIGDIIKVQNKTLKSHEDVLKQLIYEKRY